MIIRYFMKTTYGGVLETYFNPGRYPDGSLLIKEWPAAPIDSVLIKPKGVGELVEALFWVDAVKARGGKVPRLVLPFFPGARQDRINNSGDYLFTAKSVADEINRRHFDEVVVVDPHSDVVPALVDRCKVVALAPLLDIPSGKYTAVISPDAGAEKRAMAVANRLGVPMIHAWKSRDTTTGAISGFGLEPTPAGALALVVDDICDGGGTFVGLGKLLKAFGQKAHLLTTHGIYSQGTSQLLEYYGHLYCTDSFDGPRDGVIETPICRSLLRGELR